MRCGDHDLDLLPLSFGVEGGLEIVQCSCGQEWGVENGAYAPVFPPVRDYDHDDQRGIELDSHWGPLMTGIALEPREAGVEL